MSRIPRSDSARSDGQRQRRLTRTIVLGSLAVAAAIAWLAIEWEADLEELLGYALVSLLLVLFSVALASAGGVLIWALRRRRR
ncbi:MAG TPA: hypothetical protein VF210_02110 [Pseudomonadales bacterium]